MKPIRTLFVSAAIAGAAVVLGVHSASAHAVVPAGNLTVAIGWLHEPAYVGADNAVQVLVKDAQGNALDSITDTDLQVEVSLGSQKMQAQPLVPTFDSDTGLGLHGEYEFHLTPTAPGNYTFHVFGKIAGKTPLDQTISAGDSTFNAVTDPTAVEFPTKVPALSDLSQKVDAITARIGTAATTASAAQAAATANQSALDDVRNTAQRGQLIGIVALLLGVLIGGAGVLAGRRLMRARS